MGESKVAAALILLQDFTVTPADITRTFGRLRTMGYDYVELPVAGEIEPQELKRLLDGEGLGVSSTHVDYERLLDDLDAVIDEQHVLGCQHVVLGALPEELRTHEGYAQFASEASQIGRKLARANLTLSYHNHYWEMERQDGRLGMEVLFEDSEPSMLSAQIDTYWIQYGGGDPAFWIRRMKGREPLVHLKDMGVHGSKQVMVEVGEGNLNWPAILRACRESGVEWYIVEQDNCDGDPFESMATSRRNLEAMGLN